MITINRVQPIYFNGNTLAGGNFSRMDLAYCDFSGSELQGANFSECDLRNARFANADLAHANFTRANIEGVDFSGAYFHDTNFRDVVGLDVPVVEHLVDRIYREAKSGHLDMSIWHSCKTTHCMAGWAILLAEEKGTALESKLGSEVAGSLIFHASIGEIPTFYCTNQEAIDWLESRLVKKV